MNTNKSTVYIAGPISGHDDLNRSAFKTMQDELESLGFHTLNPHEFCESIKSPNPSDPKYYRAGMITLASQATDIIFLDGWQYSAGAQLEHKAAALFGIGIHFSTEDLIRKYSNQ